jgi:serine/threonine-protein kinase RsbW
LRDNGEVIRLKVPTDPFSSQIIRLAVYLVASRMNYDLSQLEDIRIAVDEASYYTLEHCLPSSTIEVEIRPGKEYLEVDLKSFVAGEESSKDALPKSFRRLIMESLVDDVEIRREGNRRLVLLRKKSPH